MNKNSKTTNKLILKKDTSKNDDIMVLVKKKIEFFKDIIQKTIIHVQKNKTLGILGISEVSSCIEKLGEISKKISEFSNIKIINTDILINNLQTINNELSSLLKSYGTDSFEDLLLVCFGNNNKITSNDNEEIRYDLLKKYFHPTSYKVINKKEEVKKNTTEQTSIEMIPNDNLKCYDVASSYKNFYMKVYGMKIFVHSDVLKKSLIVFGIVDDVIIDLLNNSYISEKYKSIIDNFHSEQEFYNEYFKNFVSSLLLKDYLIYDTNLEIYNKFNGVLYNGNLLTQKQTAIVIKEFISDDLYNKRNILISLLIKSINYDNQYLSYLLYDLLSNDNNGTVDTHEQVSLFDSFPWSIKKLFKNAMKNTNDYTIELTNYDVNKIPLEQQICLIKANDSVKEKAMMKLKEVKAKSEDSGSKARQYLEGLLKVPFNIFRREPILNVMTNIKNLFKEIYKKYNFEHKFPEILNKDNYTSIEIFQYIKKIKNNSDINNKSIHLDKIKKYLLSVDKKKLVENIIYINELFKKYNILEQTIKYKSINKKDIIIQLNIFFEYCKNNDNTEIVNTIINNYGNLYDNKDNNSILLEKDVVIIDEQIKEINNYMVNVKLTLDKSVYGHDKAKKQIERIIGQWINGCQDGYCFGFEGPPGVGKTSLAKIGLADCLKDSEGNSRPFAMIQMGGDSNGSTLHGHNYTYVGSTWGSIVQILIDKKCMNPIIFIDEVDKISRTEHGKEIVGILTHLLDPTQNDCFQDKYFTGVDFDLSKALFILSYNDVEAIDRILLDRIHRVKFNSLTLDEKITICNKHILPDIYKKMGLENTFKLSEDVLKFLIDEYTCEAGVRKLKEILFEIIGEINLNILKNNDKVKELPINITIEEIKSNYFKDKHEIKNKKIHTDNKIGVINGLWANALGKGGVIPIQVNWRPSDKFLSLYLTGLQGDVMKESMNVALTLAWNLTPEMIKDEIRQKYSTDINYGIHIHCPEGAVPKDGPSAGTAITTAIYSILNNRKIKCDIAITGEISLDGFVTEIGGLDLKILGAIKAGVKEILYPSENKKDYNTFIEKYKNNPLLDGIKFHSIDKINEVFELVFE
jgi:ATP-dependent Lon protease